ncbi:hypothetical protein G7054_g590 [Neopestalotiopsis clavispora]|nr:hypothetical protein G7054_g590 [Neopestalotiopsis clavispora]
MAADSTSWTSVQTFLQSGDDEAIACFKQVKWDQLCGIASDANQSLECVVLDHIASGWNHAVRQLEFSDKSRWAARIPISRGQPPSSIGTKLGKEVATMQFIRDHSTLRVPQVFAYHTDANNAAETAFMLIEMLPGIVAMDAHGGHKVQLTSMRLPKIGTIIRNEDGQYDLGPIPGIGGPFDTAAAFFESWAEKAKFPRDKEEITQILQRTPMPVEEMLQIIDDFPRQIKGMAKQLPLCNEGPFPLCHDDFLHSNIIVDETSFNVTGIIDWEGACTAPWGLVAYPQFLAVMPRSFDLPEHYDQNGQPLEEDTRERWSERRDYVQMVKLVEGEDSLLSECLSDGVVALYQIESSVAQYGGEGVLLSFGAKVE